jgi:hypothetical protein
VCGTADDQNPCGTTGDSSLAISSRDAKTTPPSGFSPHNSVSAFIRPLSDFYFFATAICASMDEATCLNFVAARRHTKVTARDFCGKAKRDE